MNNLVWTSISKGIEDCLLDWIISLRNEGKYKGKVLILNYGANPSVINFIKKYNVNIIDIDLSTTHNKYNKDLRKIFSKLKTPTHGFNEREIKLNPIHIKNDLIVNYRYIDIIPILEEQYPNYNTAHFDVDIWFQDDINPLFNDIEKAKGCLFSPALFTKNIEIMKKLLDTKNFNGINFTFIKRVLPLLNTKDTKVFKNKIEFIFRNTNGHINGGFIAGKSNLVLDKFKEFRNKIETFEWPNIRGSNQAFLNYSFDIEKDDGSYFLYNAMPKKDENLLFNSNDSCFYKNGIKCKAIHTLEFKYIQFKINYFDLFWKEINE